MWGWGRSRVSGRKPNWRSCSMCTPPRTPFATRWTPSIRITTKTVVCRRAGAPLERCVSNSSPAHRRTRRAARTAGRFTQERRSRRTHKLRNGPVPALESPASTFEIKRRILRTVLKKLGYEAGPHHPSASSPAARPTHRTRTPTNRTGQHRWVTDTETIDTIRALASQSA